MNLTICFDEGFRIGLFGCLNLLDKLTFFILRQAIIFLIGFGQICANTLFQAEPGGLSIDDFDPGLTLFRF